MLWRSPVGCPVILGNPSGKALGWRGNDFSATLEASAAVGFEEFMSSVDAIVMGRKTFETVRDMEDGPMVLLGLRNPFRGAPWPYGDLPVTVLTEKGVVVPERLRGGSAARSFGLREEILANLAKSGVRDVYVDGGQTIRKFLTAGLLTRILVSEVPVTLGDGVPLFSAQDLSRLKEVSSRKLEGGMRQVTYTARARPEHE
ncbi:Uncharacterized protein YyaP [Durusdinium trenchii]|uniref:Uncharacterized protein YyaP n=1 Tax=Durusdinium trenchii TaxID=1381693 RepID=A0ABP0LZT5_9DINO